MSRWRRLLGKDRLGALWALKLSTGMRRGELFTLEWGDVDLARGYIAVRHSRVKVAGGTRVEGTKDKRGRRIDLSDAQVALLRGHQAWQDAERQAAGLAWPGHDLGFTWDGGTPLSPSTYGRQWHALLWRAGVAHMRPHDLRHLNATVLLEAGIHPKVVQERLGHASSAIMLDIYSYVIPGMSHRAAEALDATLDDEADPDAPGEPTP